MPARDADAGRAEPRVVGNAEDGRMRRPSSGEDVRRNESCEDEEGEKEEEEEEEVDDN